MIGKLADLQRYLHTTGGGAGNPNEELLLTSILEAASRRFARQVPERTLQPTPATATDDPVALTFQLRSPVIQVPDLREVTLIEINGVEHTGGYDVIARPGEPALWLRLRGANYGAGVSINPATYYGQQWLGRAVTITGRWGPEEVDPDVLEAVLVWAARVYHERQARYSDARTDADGGVDSYFRTIPPAIKATLNALRVPGV